jgi:hypothetical protein
MYTIFVGERVTGDGCKTTVALVGIVKLLTWHGRCMHVMVWLMLHDVMVALDIIVMDMMADACMMLWTVWLMHAWYYDHYGRCMMLWTCWL